MTPERLRPEDARILSLEAENVRGHTVKVLVLESDSGAAPPGAERLREHVGMRLQRVPRLRQRLAPTPFNVAAPLWVDDPGFDLTRHIVAIRTAMRVIRDDLPDIVAGVMQERLDRAHPLWRIDVVERLEENSSALIWRIHHAMADGIAALRIGAAILWEHELDAPAPPLASPWVPEPPPGALRLLTLGLGTRLRTGTRRLSSASYVPSPARWRAAMTDLPRVEAVVRRELAPAGGETPLDRPAGPRRCVAFASAELAELKRIGKAFGESVKINDVVLTAVAGAIRDWLARRRSDAGRVRVQVPVSLHEHREQTDELGNRDSYFFVELPIHERDPVARLLAINAQTSDRKRHGDAEVLYHLPMRGVLDRWGMSPRMFTFNVSNVPGPRETIYVAGARVRELYSLAEIAEHHALRIAAVSAAGRLSFGICADRDVVEDVDSIALGLEDALGELAARAPNRPG